MKSMTVSLLSRLSGLSPQTIRNYADLGLIEVQEDVSNGYRYFSASSINQTYAVRRMSELGFSIRDIQEIMGPATSERYEAMFDALARQTQEEIAYRQDVLSMIRIHQESVTGFRTRLNAGRIIPGEAFYCLDYAVNDETLLSDAAPLVRQWIPHAAFVRIYSPFPVQALHAGAPDKVIGFIIPEQFSRHFPLDAPVYRRSAARYAVFPIKNDDHMTILNGGREHVLRFLEENRLTIAGEPFFIGNIPFFEEEQKVFFATLYVPIEP